MLLKPLVILVTKRSNESDHVRRELELATEYNLAILPLYINMLFPAKKSSKQVK
jgi:hypothetical protein